MDDVLASLARNMRRQRGIRGLSTAEVARRSQVARATLSQLESGRGNPTLDTLLAVSEVLGISVTDLMANDPAPPMTVARAAVDGAAFSDRLLRRFPAGPCLVDLHELRVSKGTTHVEQARAGGTHEHIVAHAGRLAICARAPSGARREVDLAPGDYVVLAADCEREFRATDGDVRATLLVHTPGRPDPRAGSNGDSAH